MRKVIYYVATSLDGYICGPGGNVDHFNIGGSGINQYLEDLKSFDTVIMGRNTYEAGYDFGMKPGDVPYPHLENYIISNSLSFEHQSDNIHIIPLSEERILDLKRKEGTPIYLCGGGMLAGWMARYGLIDQLKIKLNPFIQGGGIRLFGESNQIILTEFIDGAVYDGGLHILTYDLKEIPLEVN